jgi:hypothetical protein
MFVFPPFNVMVMVMLLQCFTAFFECFFFQFWSSRIFFLPAKRVESRPALLPADFTTLTGVTKDENTPNFESCFPNFEILKMP